MSQSTILKHGHFLAGLCNQAIAGPRQHNTLVLACNLPEEVYRKIFILCAQVSVATKCSTPDGTWSWVNISYVCSAWRRVSLGCQDLWRHIDFSHPKWYSITMERAKIAPLHVNAVVADSNIRLVQRTLQLAHRIQDIRLRCDIPNIHPLLEILAHPNPSVESLIVEIQKPISRPFDETHASPSFPIIGPPLLNLKCMELHSTPFYLLTSRCTNLTRLQLHDLPLIERPTFCHFFAMLQQLQSLEYLTLDRSFPINVESVDLQSFNHPITLSKLKTISLVGSVIEIANTLRYFSLPPSTSLIIKVCSLADLRNNIWRLSQTLNDHCYFLSDDLPMETLVLSGQDAGTRFIGDGFDPNPDFRHSSRIRVFRASCDSGSAAIDFTFEPYEDHSDDELKIVVLIGIMRALPLYQIRTLAVRDVEFMTQKTWSQVLRMLPCIQVLDITGSPPSGLAWALLLNASLNEQAFKIPEDGGYDKLIFTPRLQDIYLHRVDCSAGGYMTSSAATVNSYYDLDDSRFLDVLNASLGERRRSGLCLRSLSLDSCGFVMRESVERARRVVLHLISDFRNSVEAGEADETCPARYRGTWNLRHPQISHYYRLRTLEMDSDFRYPYL